MVGPDLCKGMTLACFHSVINLPLSKGLFIMEVRGFEIIGAAILNNPQEILSRPTALFSGMWDNCFSTKSVGIVGKWKVGMPEGRSELVKMEELWGGSLLTRSLPMEVKYSVYAFAMPFELVIILPFTSSPFRLGLDFPGRRCLKHVRINWGLFVFSKILPL